AVSALILFAGYSAAKDTLGPLLGQAPEPEFIQKIQRIVMESNIVTGIHDLIIHDYGPGRQMISLHAEVPVNVDILAAHDTIDNLERELKEQLGCDAVIHMDPIATDDELTTKLKAQVMIFAEEIAPEIGIHDFRVVTGDTHTNIIFDAVVPFNLEAEDVKSQLGSRIEAMQPEDDSTDRYYAVINIDRPYH
ncbi:MAG: cation-efflux pump, partial [Firmicutes bacterium]|nr:cation-efflux pump [Bacillota bacterium]